MKDKLSCFRRILKITYRDRVTKEEIDRRTSCVPHADIVVRTRFALRTIYCVRLLSGFLKRLPQCGRKRKGRPNVGPLRNNYIFGHELRRS